MAWWMQAALIAVGAVTVICVLAAAVRCGKPLRRLCSSATQGLAALLLVNLTAGLSGVSLGFSWLSLGCCGVLGVPGAIGLVLLQIVLPMGSG